MDEQGVPAIQLGQAAGLNDFLVRVASSSNLQEILSSPPPETVVLPVDWVCDSARSPGYTIELSTRGATPYVFFLHVIVELHPSSFAVIGFSQNQVNGPGGGYGGRLPMIDWDPRLDWLRWSIFVAPGIVTYRAAAHHRLLDPCSDGRTLAGVPFPHTVRAIVLGSAEVMSAVAEVRMWDGQLFDVLDDQLELLGNRRLDGRESALVGYWKLGEGSGSRLEDSSRFGHDGVVTGGRWLAASESDLRLDCSLDLVRRRRKALIDLADAIRSQRDEIARRMQEVQSVRKHSDQIKKELELFEGRKEQVLADRKRELKALKDAFQEWKQRIQDGGKVGLDYFSESLAKEVEGASAELIREKSPYRLQSVAFEVKMLPVQKEGAQDFLVTFPQPDDDNVQPGQLSTLSLSLEPRPPTPLRAEQVVPDVLGYTELVARRLLAKRGFQVEVMDQATDKPEKVNRVIDQEPKGGTSTGPGQGLHKPVTLFLGRAGDSGGG